MLLNKSNREDEFATEKIEPKESKTKIILPMYSRHCDVLLRFSIAGAQTVNRRTRLDFFSLFLKGEGGAELYIF